MKHATATALSKLEPLLQRVRALETLKERSRGVFYRGSQAFLHFHEDPAGLFADVRFAGDWERCPVNLKSEQAALVRKIKSSLTPAANASAGKSKRD